MIVAALYLPQFHRIPENDSWWGEGFTEWTNVRRAKPLFPGHEQPRVPRDDRYYDLLERDVMRWQSDLASRHGVDAFCFYHYWFGGKLLLERPVENYLAWKEIPTGFFLSWANEPWARTWDGREKEVLMPQVYGAEEDWEAHFAYLLPFFQDSRYLRIDGAPVFVLYRTESIPRCEEMVAHWDRRCREEGFEGIHIVETLNGFQDGPMLSASKALMPMEPTFTMRWDYPLWRRVLRKVRSLVVGAGPQTFSYRAVWRRIVRRDARWPGKETCPCLFVDWDNSPRKKERAAIFLGCRPEIFEKYASKVVERSRKAGTRLLFVNAWNEWAEGTYLEPDTRHGTGFLEILSRIRG